MLMQLEALAAKHGINLISIGSSSSPSDLAVIPQLIAATQHLSCSFCMPATADWTLCQHSSSSSYADGSPYRWDNEREQKHWHTASSNRALPVWLSEW